MPIEEFVRARAKKGTSTSGPKVYADERGVLARVYHEAAAVRAGHDHAGVARYYVRLIDTNLGLCEIDHQLERAVRYDAFASVGRPILERPQVLYEAVEWW
jgi:hypothetical protein